jgi:hypothetical protein
VDATTAVYVVALREPGPTAVASHTVVRARRVTNLPARGCTPALAVFAPDLGADAEVDLGVPTDSGDDSARQG